MKSNLSKSLVVLSLTSSMLMAQTSKQIHPIATTVAGENTETPIFKNRGCATVVPEMQWEDALQKMIADRKLQESNGNKVQANYNIPIIIHIIHGGQSVGTYPNISNAQAVSQVNVLNNDFGGTGLNVANYPSNAFTNYATAAALPAANKDANGRPKISNLNLSFCLVPLNKNGVTMAEVGIDRVNINTFTLSAGYASKDPANVAYNSPATFQDFIDNIVKPQTIWDPIKYMNIWVSDVNSGAGLLGFATFPVGVTIPGNPIGNTGTATTDGLWCWGKAFGNTGTLNPSFSKGRTATHEIGHWAGLRHIWGDGSCATDYCLDTPPAASPNYGTFTYPYKPNTCTTPTGANNTTPNGANGEMFMNFMDYTDDLAMFMFTEDQRTRVQTCMANGTYRKLLGTHGLCSPGVATPAVSSFSIQSTGCLNSPISLVNNSSGTPFPTSSWSSSPSTGAVFMPNTSANAPTITFTNVGKYIITLSAQSGTTAVSTSTMAITITTCAITTCIDTLSNITNTDYLNVYTLPTSATCLTGGFVTGTNCRATKEYAEYYSGNGFIGNAKIVGGIVVFFKDGNNGTKGAANVTFNVYNGNNTTGPGASIGSFIGNLTNIAATPPTKTINFIGTGGTFTKPIALPYSFNLAAPVNITGDFLLGVTVPATSGDTISIFQNAVSNTHTISTAWEKHSDNMWYSFGDATNSWGMMGSLAILPKIACTANGIIDPNGISSNYAIFPNPSEGMFNFAVTLPTARDLQFTVSNSIGQEVYSRNEIAVTNSVISLDLSHLSKGIYVVTIIDSKGDKVMRKLIIQ